MIQDTKTNFVGGFISALLPALFAILPLIYDFKGTGNEVVFSISARSIFLWILAGLLYWLSIWILASCKHQMASRLAIFLRHGTQVVTGVFTFVVAFAALIQFMFPSITIRWNLGITGSQAAWLTIIYFALLSLSGAMTIANKWIKEKRAFYYALR